jgi:hypothetical protein
MSADQPPDDFELAARRSATPLGRLLDCLFHPNFLLAVSCVVAAFVFLPKLGLRWPELPRNAEYRLRTSNIEITAPPHWIPHDLVEQVARRSELPDELSVLDRSLARRLAESFERHPWVKKCRKVSVSVPARIQVELEYREPVAIVNVVHATKTAMFAIDAEATLLPTADFSPAEIANYPAIVNVSERPAQTDGLIWKNPSVLAAARLAALLKPHWKEFGFQAIRVPAAVERDASDDDVPLQIVTRGGSRVIWGRPPGANHPGELLAEKKIERIKFYLKHHGPFDAPHGPYEYDITRWKDISRRRIADLSEAPSR